MTLKVYNGRGWGRARYDDKEGHTRIPVSIQEYADSINMCGHSKKDIVRYIQLAGGGNNYTLSELSNYASPCWGNPMEGIEKRPGVWADQGYHSKMILLLRAEVLLVNCAVVSEIEGFLAKDKPVPDAGLDEVMNTFMANFGEGIEADIKFCNGDTGPYIDAVLFDEGSEVFVLEPSDILEGEYVFEYQDVKYVVDIRPKKMKEIYKQA